MFVRWSILRVGFFMAAFACGTGMVRSAVASDPLPGDAVMLPANTNIALFYNEFSDAGEYGAVHGGNTTDHVHISTDIAVARYVRSFQAGPFIAGVQAYVPYVAFLGNQRVGTATPFGPARANLSSNSGFAQPYLGAFFWPYGNANTGTYVPLGFWIAPPISSYSRSDALNAGPDSTVFELEAGFRTQLFGTAKTTSLAMELWGESYFFFNNAKSAAVTPTLTFDNIPGLVVGQTVTPATYRQQPSEEFRVYFPYTFFPAAAGQITPGFFQSFGGKQTFAIHGGPVADSGNRTDESQIRLIGSMFVSPTAQVMLVGGYDVAAHGGPLNRYLTLRLVKFF